MDEKDVAYVAGFFDGEGSACICATYMVKVCISQKLPQVLYWIKGEFGGNVHLESKSQGAAHLSFHNKTDMTKFLTAIRPYLRVKSVDVDLCLQMLELQSDNHTRPQAKNGLFLKNPNGDARKKIYDEYKRYRANCYKTV